MYKISVSVRQLAGAFIILTLLLMRTSLCFAQNPADLWQDTSWSAYGAQAGEEYGFAGLSYLGKLDTAQNAIAIGETSRMSWVLNRKKLDTGTFYLSPGQYVATGDFNGDKIPDYITWGSSGDVTVLLGTSQSGKYDTAFILHYGTRSFAVGWSAFVKKEVLVCNCDSDQYDDFLISDFAAGKIYLFRGGATLDSLPSDSIATAAQALAVGNVLDISKKFIAQYYWSNGKYFSDTVLITLYPLSKDGFHFVPSKEIICNVASHGAPAGGFLLDDADADGISDILIACGDAVLIYKGGDSISSIPTYYLTDVPSSVAPYLVAPGSDIIDVGNVVSTKYHSLIVTDPQYGGDLFSEPGAIFMYNLGIALKDTCVAYAIEGFGTQAELGSRVIGIGRYPGDTLDGFMVGELSGYSNSASGEIIAFKGNGSYGTSNVIQETEFLPTIFNLSQNYPNPFYGTTTLSFSILNSHLFGAEVTIKLCDELGRYVETIYTGKADGYGYTIGFNAGNLPAGIYFYRLACGGKEIAKMMNVMK